MCFHLLLFHNTYTFNHPPYFFMLILDSLNDMARQSRKTMEQIRLHASEIGQYHFCSASWYLQRCGYRPDSNKLTVGLKKHVALGKTLISLDRQSRFVRFIRFTALGIILIALLILFLEVASSML